MACKARPYRSLTEGSWFKLIGGASHQDIPTLANLALVYTLAEVDCIDVSADPAVVAEVDAAIGHALRLKGCGREEAPFLMVSLSDGADPHFRKARFDPEFCPPDCARPCLRICPVDAIAPAGIDQQRCYGCGRCAPVCPLGLIVYADHCADPTTVGQLLADCAIDAVEVHTHQGNLEGFRRLWQGLTPLLPRLRLVAISFPDEPGMSTHLQQLWEVIAASELSPVAREHLVWQIDGLPMSGDLARGTARTSVQFAQKVQHWQLPGFLQLAGGTNDASAEMARSAALAISGIGYGSYARKLVQAETEAGPLIEQPELLHRAVARARTLVGQLKPHLREVTPHG